MKKGTIESYWIDEGVKYERMRQKFYWYIIMHSKPIFVFPAGLGLGLGLYKIFLFPWNDG